MTDLHDYEFQHADRAPVPEADRGLRYWLIAVGLVVVAAAAGTYLIVGRHRIPAPVSPASRAARAPSREEPSRPLGGVAEAVSVPPLGDSDAIVRTLARALSNHRLVAAWLATDGLIRSFTVAVTNIAEGTSPAKPLRVLRPTSAFPVGANQGGFTIEPRSYARFTPVADAVRSVDATAAANLYATLKPRIDEAAGELGVPPGRFDRVVEDAIVRLLRTPIPDRPHVMPNVEGIGYAFVDDRLEQLSPAQKALIRMGPHNAAAIKMKLREIALALGIPAAHLPVVEG